MAPINMQSKGRLLAAVAAVLLVLLPIPPAAAAPPPPLLRPRGGGRSLLFNGTTNRLAAPVIDCGASTETSITVEVCPGKDHPAAPYGFKLQWATLESFVEAGGWCCAKGPADACAARTSGAFVDTDDCWLVDLGGGPEQGVTYRPPACGADSLACGMGYALRAFALGGPGFNGSVASAGVICSTDEC